uniref:Reverse transcriptase zinc-binding domain-containing protein n=1 Tax=Chenopodium quinoa TaxID=63459 RepID=A0A803LLH1_CHEQI
MRLSSVSYAFKWNGQVDGKISTFNVESSVDLCVAELIDDDRHCWDIAALHQHLTVEDAALAQGIPLSLNQVEDSMYWWPATDGVYSTKSGYLMARMGHVRGWTARFWGDRAEIWNSIWNIGGPPKLCQFLWRACTESLATFGRLQQRHIRDDGVCGVFYSAQESIIHAIFLCPSVNQVWELSPFADLLRDAPSDQNFVDRFAWMKGKVSKSELLVLAALAWATWSYRNSVVFENPWQNRDIGVLGFLRLVKDYKSYCNAVSPRAPAAVTRNMWKPPAAGLVRVNSDAAVISEVAASIGVVLRDDQGVILAAKVKRIAGKRSVKVLEAMAARLGLQVARDLGYGRVELESDALSVTKSDQLDKGRHDSVGFDYR